MESTKKLRFLMVLVALLLLLPAVSTGLDGDDTLAASNTKQVEQKRIATMNDAARTSYPLMKPSPETLDQWMESRDSTPSAYINPQDRDRLLLFPQEHSNKSANLLGFLDYIPSERDQGDCGNCWVWAGTGAIEIALDVQNGIRDRLSIQYLNSNYYGPYGWAGNGGEFTDFADFYSKAGMAIPWSNTKAYWQDGSGGDSSSVPANAISTIPNYPIDSIETQLIPTWGTGEATAIANIKTVLRQGKAIPFAFYMPKMEHWINFIDFWVGESETAIWNPDYSCGQDWDNGAGHAVLCVGYNDDPGEDNDYWIMLNSWGTAYGGRPSGLFRMDMHMNYDGKFEYNGEWLSSFQWWIMNITYDIDGIYYFKDPRRESELYVYSGVNVFRFTAPNGYDSGPVKAGYLRVTYFNGQPSIYITHKSRSMTLATATMPGFPDYLKATLTSNTQRRTMLLVDPPGIESHSPIWL